MIRASGTVRGWGRAAARALVPWGGSWLDEHLSNFEALKGHLASWGGPGPSDRVLIVAPHPDDETLGCGGLLARCAARSVPARVVFLTSGDGSRTTWLALKARQPLRGAATPREIAVRRQEEARAALARLGWSDENDAQFLGFPDGALLEILAASFAVTARSSGAARADLPGVAFPGLPFTREGLVSALASCLEEFAPTVVLSTPSADTHPDHRAAMAATRAAMASLDETVQPRLFTFLIHHGVWPVPNGAHPDLPLAPPARLLSSCGSWRRMDLEPAEIEAKAAALECHASQLASTPRYLRSFVRRNELFCEGDLRDARNTTGASSP